MFAKKNKIVQELSRGKHLFTQIQKLKSVWLVEESPKNIYLLKNAGFLFRSQQKKIFQNSFFSMDKKSKYKH